MRAITAIASATTSALLLGGCAASTSTDEDASLTVAAAFYPLEFVANEVGGEHVDVVPLTAPGVEAHDVELSPATVRELGSADLALFLSDFQPAVDDAVATSGITALDAASVLDLHAEEHEEEHDDSPASDEHADEHDHAAGDPHFWLDPHLLADVGSAVAELFAEADPANAQAYASNADALQARLEQLDESYETGLAQCARDTIVVSHEAFGYLADAYGLHQEGIAGLDPENEPSPARLLEIQEIIETSGATTVFAEDEVSAGVAQALADDAGVDTAVLDPVESVAHGDDYIGVMTRNLDALRLALDCD